MEHPKAIGDRSTLAIMLALQTAGYAVSVPFGENTRYDLLIDDGIRIVRVQCKTGRLRGGGIRFATSSSYAHHASPRERQRDYRGQIDFFAVFCPESHGVYLIPIEDVQTTNAAMLRVEPPRNHQKRRIRSAADYALATVRLGSAPAPSRLDLAA